MFSQFISAQQLFSLHRDVFRSASSLLMPAIWYEALGNALAADGINGGVWMGDDFVNFHGWAPAVSGAVSVPSSTIPSPSGYGFYTDTATTACSITQKSGAMNTCRMSVGATDNHEAWMTTGGNTGALGRLGHSDPLGVDTRCTAGDERFAALEVVFSVPQIGANNGCVFLGLGEPGMAAANTKVDDTGVMADKDWIGFDTQQDDPSLLDIMYREEGSAQQLVKAGAHTLVADTLVHVGLVFNPKWPPSEKIRFYINNAELSEKVSLTSMNASTFPNNVMMSFLAGLKTGSATAAHLDIKRWRFFQAER